jgi:hypothetical protein
MKTAVGGTNLNSMNFGENAVLPFNVIDQS